MYCISASNHDVSITKAINRQQKPPLTQPVPPISEKEIQTKTRANRGNKQYPYPRPNLTEKAKDRHPAKRSD